MSPSIGEVTERQESEHETDTKTGRSLLIRERTVRPKTRKGDSILIVTKTERTNEHRMGTPAMIREGSSTKCDVVRARVLIGKGAELAAARLQYLAAGGTIYPT
jgi:hypothetical protein